MNISVTTARARDDMESYSTKTESIDL